MSETNSKNHPARKTVMDFLKEVYDIWIKERPAQFAAALAYYGVFTVIPVIYIAFWLADLIVRRFSISDWFYTEAYDLLGDEVASYLQEGVNSLAASTTGGSTLTTIIGVVALLFSASLIFYQLQVVLIFILAAAINPVIWVVASYVSLNYLVGLLSFLALAGLATLSFASIYKLLANAHIAWRDIWFGAGVAGLAVAIVVSFLGLYLSASRVSSALEAASAMAVLLIFFYVLGQIFAIGAILVRVYAAMFGSGIIPKSENENS